MIGIFLCLLHSAIRKTSLSSKNVSSAYTDEVIEGKVVDRRLL